MILLLSLLTYLIPTSTCSFGRSTSCSAAPNRNATRWAPNTSVSGLPVAVPLVIWAGHSVTPTCWWTAVVASYCTAYIETENQRLKSHTIKCIANQNARKLFYMRWYSAVSLVSLNIVMIYNIDKKSKTVCSCKALGDWQNVRWRSVEKHTTPLLVLLLTLVLCSANSRVFYICTQRAFYFFTTHFELHIGSWIHQNCLYNRLHHHIKNALGCTRCYCTGIQTDLINMLEKWNDIYLLYEGWW